MTSGALTAGVVVLLVSLGAVAGPLVGLSPWWITLLVALGLGSLTVDAARFGGRGGHLLAEALPRQRLQALDVALAGRGLCLQVGHEVG